jgi:hypothetical protein
MVLAAAASVLIVLGLATWAMLRQGHQQVIAAVVDLKDRSLPRGTASPQNESPIEISRSASRLEIYLPLGSSEGLYDVRVASTEGESVSSGSANATIEGSATVLLVDLQPRLPETGSYVLQIRKSPSEWASFPMRLR